MSTEAARGDDAAPSVGNGLVIARVRLTKAVLEKTLDPRDFPHAFAQAVDGWVKELFAKAAHQRERGCALLGVGGYGRGELFPGSDLDLVFIHKMRRDYQRISSEIWYPIWDTGTRLDHSVRTRREALAVASTDLKVILGLLDARLIAGDATVVARLFDDIQSLWQRSAGTFLRELDQQMQARHDRSGELAFLLEPDLKQSAGGLRDIAVLQAIGRGLPHLQPLISKPLLLEAQRLIEAARVVVHCTTNSANDRLLLQEQDRVADLLGFSDADVLMARMAEAGRAVTTASMEVWRRVRHELFPKARSESLGTQSIGRGLLLRNGEVSLEKDVASNDPSVLLDLAIAAAQHNVPIETESLDLLSANVSAPSAPWAVELREKFITLLSAGHAMIPVVEALDQRRLFELFLPEWQHARNRPQRNAYHRFTVDRHLLEAVALCAEHLDQVSRPDLLIMSALLHDIGKGYAGDHSEEGKEIAEQVGTRMGYPKADIDVLQQLVAFHLVLSEFATRRDLNDPSTALVVAKLVGNRTVLELLANLSEVDGRATGPAAWGPWKAELVAALTERVAQVLDGKPQLVEPPKPSPDQMELLSLGQVAVRANGRRVTVVSPDRPGLLATVTGTLALNGCNVKRATAYEGVPGIALEVFDLEPSFDRLPDWSQVEKEVIAALEGRVALNERLIERDAAYSRLRRPSSASPPRAEITVDNEMSLSASIIEVRAPDRVGLLHDIAGAFASAGFDVVSAIVDTLGHEVIDTFYVHNSGGEKLTAEQIADVRTLLEGVIVRGN